MTTFEESYANAKDNAFQQRVTTAIYKAAQDVASESNVGKADAWYSKRQALAFRVKNGGESLVPQWALSICSGGTITPASLDPDIELAVDAQWDAFAGVTELDKV
jgi:hypothetical protein